MKDGAVILGPVGRAEAAGVGRWAQASAKAEALLTCKRVCLLWSWRSLGFQSASRLLRLVIMLKSVIKQELA